MITGCGSKGDLYLPKKEPEQTKIPNPKNIDINKNH